MEIGYVTELCKPYADSLRRVKTNAELKSHLAAWSMLAGDAADAFDSPEFSWKEYAPGARKERRGVFAGEKWVGKYGAILMPEILMRIAIIANEYLVPDGCVFIRLREMGQIVVKDGRAKIVAATKKGDGG